MSELALKLTVDGNGNNATSGAFDPENIVQFGYHHQWADLRGWGNFAACAPAAKIHEFQFTGTTEF